MDGCDEISLLLGIFLIKLKNKFSLMAAVSKKLNSVAKMSLIDLISSK